MADTSFLSAINLNLPETPQAFSGDVILYQELLQIYNALRILQQAINVLVTQTSVSPVVMEVSTDFIIMRVVVEGVEKIIKLPLSVPIEE